MENKRYWRGIEEFTNDVEFVKNAHQEFPEVIEEPENEDGQNPNRRDFLKLLGFSVAAVSLASCETPVKYAVPYLRKPDNVDPSVPNYYASTFYDGYDYCSILVKTREGRPIKVDGNRLSSFSMGGTSARAQASVLDLYDVTRYKGFSKREGNKQSEVASKADDRLKANKKIDAEIKSKLASANSIFIVSPTIISPTTKKAIEDFTKQYSSAKHVMYDTQSANAMLEVNKAKFGKRALPFYSFDKADVIVSVGADFMGTWLSPTQFSKQYSKTRKITDTKKTLSRLYQFEARLSLSGANADYRTPIKPSEYGKVLADIYDGITSGAKSKFKHVNKAIEDLKGSKGKSIIICDYNDENIQTVVNAINQELGNYGNTISMDNPVYLQQGDDKAMNDFISKAKNGSVDVAIFFGTNPAYNHPRGKELEDALKSKKIKTSISFATHPDETANVCSYICPNHHYLESWGDAMPQQGSYSLIQPSITPIYSTRQAEESLLLWAGQETEYYKYLKDFWKKAILKDKTNEAWQKVLHDGVYSSDTVIVSTPQVTPVTPAPVQVIPTTTEEEVVQTVSTDVSSALSAIKGMKGSSLELCLYEKVAIGAGNQANNPFLQEMPDPISKACWENYVAVPIKMAKDKGWSQGDMVKVTANGKSVELPVLVQPGQAKGTISIAVGYGRRFAGKVALNQYVRNASLKDAKLGQDVFPLLGKGTSYYISTATLGSSDKPKMQIAQTQTHHTINGRFQLAMELNLDEYSQKLEKYNNGAKGLDNPFREHIPKIHTSEGSKFPTEITLWKGHEYRNHSWGLVVDLNSCTGCGSCTIACQVENNIPVVGKKEVLMRREMHWIRIDRYYSNSPETTEKFKKGEIDFTSQLLEEPGENPQVMFQPVMCQHCNNAPCETVCPVLATTHSTEGLNQMTYNRCFGTRYCANNCPFKVRRFNWFHYAEDHRFQEQNYAQTTDLGKMVLNPDVTVRSRGVMEKCSMCVQKIQAGKLDAKRRKERVKDGDIQMACSEACPTDAITFGDMNDKETQIAEMLKIEKDVEKIGNGKKTRTTYKITEPRAFHMLEEISVRPQVSYLTKIRNIDSPKGKLKEKEKGEKHHS